MNHELRVHLILFNGRDVRIMTNKRGKIHNEENKDIVQVAKCLTCRGQDGAS